MVNDEEYNKVVEKLEPMPDIPDLSIDDFNSLELTATVSIAISLKRIADKLELAQKQPIMMNAEEGLKYYKAKEAYDAGVAAMRKSSTP